MLCLSVTNILLLSMRFTIPLKLEESNTQLKIKMLLMSITNIVIEDTNEMKHTIYSKVNFLSLLSGWIAAHFDQKGGCWYFSSWSLPWTTKYPLMQVHSDASVRGSILHRFSPRSHLEWDFPISPHFKGKLHLTGTIFTVRHIHFSFLQDF